MALYCVPVAKTYIAAATELLEVNKYKFSYMYCSWWARDVTEGIAVEQQGAVQTVIDLTSG